MDIADWLRMLGLEQYEQLFRDNHIDAEMLPTLVADDLRQLGISSLGHRKKLLAAVAALNEHQRVATGQSRDESTLSSAERRQLTLMFCDLVDSTQLATRLDPEDLSEVMGAYHRCCTELVERNGGFIAKYMGDGVLAYFGYPEADEHGAERAIHAGLALVQSVPKLKTAATGPLQMRVGIATGLVVVGDLAGTAQEQAVVGETPNLAARLQALAEPGAVVISSSTRQLTGRLFDYRDLGTLALKGFDGSVSAFQVVGVGATQSRFEALRASTTPLVGRADVIDLLNARWQRAKRGEGCVALVSGEPGIGKSRVAQTVLERVGNESCARLHYFCSPHHQDSELFPCIAQLHRSAGFRRDDTSEQRLAKLEAVLSCATNDVDGIVPLLADLLSVPTGERYPARNVSAHRRKERTLQALLAQVAGLAARQPVLITFEDVHWSDPTTREFLDLLVERVPALRVLTIITFRTEFKPPWIGRAHVTHLNLNRLPPAQCAEMIARMAGGKALPKVVADQIIDRTDGVPLFIEELTKAVVERGILGKSRDRDDTSAPVSALAIPSTLQASLLARLDRSAQTREVAQIASALGRQFSHELINAVAQMPQRQLEDALAQLLEAELIFRRGVPPDAEYIFKHALVQDAAYGTLLRVRRQQLHHNIASTMEAQFPDIVETQPEVLARHFAEAGRGEQAVSYWQKAGLRALARSAMTEAVAQLQKGLDLLANLPEAARRQQQELALRVALGPALIATNGFSAPIVGETYARARMLAERLSRPEHLGPLLFGQFVFYNMRADRKLALSHAEQLEQFGEAQNDVAALLLGHYTRGIASMWLGDLIAARDLFEQCHAMNDPARRSLYRATTGADQYLAMLAHLGLTSTCLGYVERGRAQVNDALLSARQLGHANSLAYVLIFTCLNEWLNGSSQSLKRRAEELIAVSSEHGFAQWLGWATMCRGISLVALGQAQQGLELQIQALSVIKSTRSVRATAAVQICLGEAYAKLGRPVEGLKSLAESAHIIEATGEGFWEVEVHRLRGELLNIVGDRSEAERSYQQALDIARRQNTKFWELHAAMSLARLWRDQGKRAEARDLLAPIYAWFTEGHRTRVLREAETLLDELRNGGPRRQRAERRAVSGRNISSPRR